MTLFVRILCRIVRRESKMLWPADDLEIILWRGAALNVKSKASTIKRRVTQPNGPIFAGRQQSNSRSSINTFGLGILQNGK